MAQLASKFSSLFNSKPTGLADTPEGYLNLAKKCMERVQKMTLPSASTLKFNHGQCRYLAQKLNLAVKNAIHISVELNIQLNREQVLSIGSSNRDQVRPQKDMVDCLEVFKLLYALAMEVENIIQSCCRDAWTQAAVTLTDVSEHISSIGFDLELWRVAFYGRKTPADVDSIFQAEVEVVKGQASIDKETLLRDINALLQRKKLSSTEYERASLLLERLERSRLTAPGDSAGSSQSSRSEKVIMGLKQMESLGKGSAGTVHKAMWLGAEFAKKTFYGPNFPDFEKEVSILVGLSHPNITPLIGYAKDKRECSIVMELMDEDLFSLMQRRLKVDKGSDSPFSILEAVDIMHQLGEGMYYLHDMKIVHRDLKSMNVLVKCVKASKSQVEYVQIKVADFGMSRTKERSMTYSNQTMNIGTTRWIAPEIIRCLDFQSPRDGETLVLQYPFKCDVYSFAMVCYEILSGDIPFSNISSPSEVKIMVLNGEHPELPSHCPEVLKNLIKRCWSLDASQRPKFGDICVELRHLKFLLLSMPTALSNIVPPAMDKSLQTRDSSPIGSKRRLGNWLVGWDFGSKTRGSSSFKKAIIFNKKITPRMLAFLDDENDLPLCRLLDEGGYGRVYRVPLQDDLVVAIKRLRNPMHDLEIDDPENFITREIRAELDTLGFIRHRNLVQLLAYVPKNDFHFLVYEYFPGGSLEDVLQQIAFGVLTLSWPERHRILCGVAQGLAYLHNESLGGAIVHRDLKPAKILLDEGYEAKISGFSLAAVVSHKTTHNSTDVIAGTIGYIAPEYHQTMRYSEKSDVFSYGVVIAQLVTGRNPTDQFVVENGGSMGQWLHICLQSSNGAIEAIDPDLQGSGYEAEILLAMKIALFCTIPDPKQRPKSTEVLKMLLQIREPNSLPATPNFKYDVFLNHREPDLKNTFLSHLAAALRRAGRDPFLGVKSPVKGQHALNYINEALTGVHVHIAIFSWGYAESKYCLNELCAMLESKKPLIPVFYDVEPEDLRWTEVGPFAEAFQKHVMKGRIEDVVRWRGALYQAASIKGFRLVDCDNDKVKLEEKIVAAVLNALPAPTPLFVARHPVGLD